MTEQQVNNQTENKANHSANIFDAVSAVVAVGGGVASAVTSNVIFTALALPVSVGVHLFNRRQVIETINEHYEQMIHNQNLHIVKTEEELQAVTTEFNEFKQDYARALSNLEPEIQTKLDALSTTVLSNLDQEIQTKLDALSTTVLSNLDQEIQAKLDSLSTTSLPNLDQEIQTKLDALAELITTLQERTDSFEQSTANLQEFTKSVESQYEQLAGVVGELCSIENYSQILRANPHAAEAYYQRGQSHQRLKEYQGAIEDYTEAIRLDGNYAKAYHSRGIVFADMGNRKAAVDDLRKAAKLYFEKAELDSYQQARDLAKQLYDLRDMIEESVQKIASESEHEEGKVQVDEAPKSVSVAKLFGDSDSEEIGLFS